MGKPVDLGTPNGRYLMSWEALQAASSVGVVVIHDALHLDERCGADEMEKRQRFNDLEWALDRGYRKCEWCFREKMSSASPEAAAIATALGLNPTDVRRLTIDISVDSVAVVTVEAYLRTDQGREIVTQLSRYNLVKSDLVLWDCPLCERTNEEAPGVTHCPYCGWPKGKPKEEPNA